LLTDDSGNTTDTYAISPYGESVAQNGSTDNPFTWLGQLGAMQEGNTSLFYLRMRYYDSATGRFLSRDPLLSADPREINPYLYADGNPVTRNDPSGLATFNVTDPQLPFLNGGQAGPGVFIPGLAYNSEAAFQIPGTPTVNLSFAPLPALNNTPSSSLPIPRFCDSSTTNNVLAVSICRANLLYPFVTNQVGFDTGLAIANTSTDPFGTEPQCGTCTLTWYGGNTAPATPGPKPGKNFQTYMNAIGNFQYAHGFAFVSDVGARNLAMGYLAIVIGDQSSNKPEVVGH
jgi:RHS repeat-associated protein